MTSKEALKHIKEELKTQWYDDCYCFEDEDEEAIEKIEKDLERLEQIDNANPSEALECLKNLEKEKEFDVVSQNFDYHYLLSEEALEQVKQALLKAQEQDKILEILKDNANLYVSEIWEEIKYIQISITSCDKRFEKVKEWLNK